MNVVCYSACDMLLAFLSIWVVCFTVWLVWCWVLFTLALVMAARFGYFLS